MLAGVGCGKGDSGKKDMSNMAKKDMMAGGQCHGINECKGKGACTGKTHDCAGKNACKGKGWLKMSKPDCDAKGGKYKAG